MEYTEWAPYYERIRQEFRFPPELERKSADRLLALLPSTAPERPLEALRARVEGRDAIVVGLAPRSGAPPLWVLPARTPVPAVLAADGAAARCLDAGLVPTLVVTDLDGPVPSEVLANARGAAVVIHAHGDNRASLERWVPEFRGELAGSWAGPPEPRLLNVGGFTDGDRAAYLAASLGARRVLLWGFDFDTVGEESSGDELRKRAKLRWAKELLGRLAEGGNPPVLLWRRDGSIVDYADGIRGASTQ